MFAVVAASAVCLPGCDEDVPAGEPIRGKIVFGGLGDTPGRLAYPRCMDADESTNALWVIDKTGRVQQLDAQTGECRSMWKMPLGENGKPTGCTLAMDDDGRPLLYVADTHYHRVMIYRADEQNGGRSEGVAVGGAARSGSSGEAELAWKPTLVGSFGEYGTGPGQFIFPTDVAIVPGENGRGVRRIFVSEYGGNDRISVFDSSFTFLFSIGTYGNDASAENVQFDRPQSMILASVPLESGTQESMSASVNVGHGALLFVADARNHRIGMFTQDGKLVRWFGDFERPGSGLGEFRIPYGLHDLKDGTALVTEYGNNRLQRIDLASGAGLGTWGRPGRGEGELFTPWAVTTIGGMVYVLDSGNNRVIGFSKPKLKLRH